MCSRYFALKSFIAKAIFDERAPLSWPIKAHNSNLEEIVIK
jgi:hypothetical protein